MKVGDKVRVVDNPISLLKVHANIEGEIVKHSRGEWLVNLNGELWWAKRFDLKVIVDDSQ